VSPVGKNHRYSKTRPARKANPALVALALVVSVTLAALCGRSLDERHRAALAGARSEGSEFESGRAALRMAPAEVSPEEQRQQILVSQIEKFSGITGGPALSLERWFAEKPAVVRGIDVSALLSEEFTLRRSFSSTYRPKKVVLAADLGRSDTFFEVRTSDGTESARILRFTNNTLSVIFRSAGGLMSEQSSLRLSHTQRCTTFEIDLSPESGSVRCKGDDASQPPLLPLPILPVGVQRISVSTNLCAPELQKLLIVGTSSGIDVEDAA
jgi:hypothetical protein